MKLSVFEEVEYLIKKVKKYESGDLSFKLPKMIRYIKNFLF